MTTYLRTLVAISVLLLVGSTGSWAGPGDIDPHFGNQGRIEGWGVTLLVLPDDRLVIGAGATDGFQVTRFDANGQVDPSFGGGGTVLIPPPTATWGFDASYAASTPDGGMLFAGLLRDSGGNQGIEAVLRLDRDGRVERSFGGHGDGFYRLTSTPFQTASYGGIPSTLMAIAVDAAGRILLAERSWTTDGRCGGPTRILRLMPSGTPDAGFGTNGRADAPGVDLCGGAPLFGARNDGSIVVGARGAIVGLDAGGTLDPTFGTGGHVPFFRIGGPLQGQPADFGRGVLLPDGDILIVHAPANSDHASGEWYHNWTVFQRFNRHGQLDATAVDLTATFYSRSDLNQWVDDFVLAPDASHVYLKLAVLDDRGTAVCASGIARVSLDGTPDVSFGRQGLTCLDYGSFGFHRLAAQRNGSPLLQHQGLQVGGVYRLLVDATPSPGMLMMVRPGTRATVGEADGTAAARVVRTAGHDGAVSVSFATGRRHSEDIDSPGAYDATPGGDFHAASGRLDWADGEEGERDITVAIIDDEIYEGEERFSIGISDPQGGALMFESDAYPDYVASVDIAIADDDPAPPAIPAPPIPPPGRATGGGGSLTWAIVLMLAALLLDRQCHRRLRTSRTRGCRPPDLLAGSERRRLLRRCSAGFATRLGIATVDDEALERDLQADRAKAWRSRKFPMHMARPDAMHLDTGRQS